MAEHEPKVGDWCVITGQWRADVGCISKVSAKQIRTHRREGREAHHVRDDVVFWGDEKSARDLVSVLHGLDERKQANLRQVARQHADSCVRAVERAKATQP